MEEDFVLETPISTGQLVLYRRVEDQGGRHVQTGVVDKGKGISPDADRERGRGLKIQGTIPFLSQGNLSDQGQKLYRDLEIGIAVQNKKQKGGKSSVSKRLRRYSP